MEGALPDDGRLPVKAVSGDVTQTCHTHSVKTCQQALNLPVFLASLAWIVPGLLMYAAVT